MSNGMKGACAAKRETIREKKIFFRRATQRDRLLAGLGHFLASSTELRSTAAMPDADEASWHGVEGDAALSPAERAHAAGLMRVNHVGEICAQALYRSQAIATRDPQLAEWLLEAARDEQRHLRWTAARLGELGSRPSLLGPLWYAGAGGIGFVAGLAGDSAALGFLAETESQVQAHLDGHLDRLPAGDQRSRDIVVKMKADEAGHAASALARGARLPPRPLRALMRAMAKVMTTTAYRV